jgi:short subunit dehydrogenase-like uncharacterized protein
VSGDRELDVVVFGATGFAGRLVAGYLAGHAPGGVRIGLAGRSQRRLAEVRAGLGVPASAWPLLVADSADPVSLAVLARAARVVVSTVGPYRAQGLALVQACAAAGTDYADLTGEVLFIRDSIDRCHDVAAGTGARIVHCCGFDSVPSDLGVLLLHHAARADDAGDLLDTTLVVTALRGGISGGTLASLMGQQDEVQASAECRRVVQDPYALSPDRAAEPDLGDERDLDWVRYDGDLRMWTGPFVMAGLNTRVVRRSNALAGWAYGRGFRYREVTGFGAGPAAPVLAVTVSGALKAAEAGLAFGPSRAMLSQLLPAPGQGPGAKTRRTGFFRMQIHTRTSAGARYLGTIAARGDPGYAATSVMLGETALCLALDRDHLPGRAGVLTPATAMGAALAARLRSAGHTLATRQITRLPLQTPSGCAARQNPVPDGLRDLGDDHGAGNADRADAGYREGLAVRLGDLERVRADLPDHRAGAIGACPHLDDERRAGQPGMVTVEPGVLRGPVLRPAGDVPDAGERAERDVAYVDHQPVRAARRIGPFIAASRKVRGAAARPGRPQTANPAPDPGGQHARDQESWPPRSFTEADSSSPRYSRNRVRYAGPLLPVALSVPGRTRSVCAQAV